MAQFAFNATGISDFNAVRLVVASPEDILKWSHGEVTKPMIEIGRASCRERV